jgi:PAS domain S-box-containing protein
MLGCGFNGTRAAENLHPFKPAGYLEPVIGSKPLHLWTATTVGHHDLSQFSLRDMIECGRMIRGGAQNAGSMEDAAQVLIRNFYQAFSGAGERNCVLVRCFKTHRLQSLPGELRAKARQALARRDVSTDDCPCLTLLATAGDLPAWNDPASSSGHAVIPLEDAAAVNRAPMIAQLIRQLGLEIEMVMDPSEDLLLEADERAYGVFHVEEAAGSPSIPAQDFVVKYGVRSVLGFGGLLPSGDLFAVIIFSRVHISRETARLFRTLALSVKLVLLPFTRGPIFASDAPPAIPAASRTHEHEQMRSEMATLRLLIPALEAAALYQTSRLQDVIADLHQQKEEFEKLGTRLSAMLESTTDAVYMLDREWRFTYLNRHAIELLQADHPLLGESIWEQFPAAVERGFWQQYHIAMNDNVAVQFEEHYPQPIDGWFEIHAFPSESGIAVFFHDITERKKVATALINNEKLAAVGRLAASIAHEINNPLESVTNLLYLARVSNEPVEVKEYLATADRELRRVGAITAQTLRFHKQSSNPTAIHCAELIDGVLSIYQGRIVNSRVEVEHRKREVEPIQCFEGEIRQVLNNLVANAIDAMHPEGGRLLLRYRNATDWRTGRKGLAITVADTGPGMSKHTRSKIFEVFFTTKGIGGTGLGLWISREIVYRHDGRLLIRSSQQVGQTGTAISLFLPARAVFR